MTPMGLFHQAVKSRPFKAIQELEYSSGAGAVRNELRNAGAGGDELEERRPEARGLRECGRSNHQSRERGGQADGGAEFLVHGAREVGR